MFIPIGQPEKISSIGSEKIDLTKAKQQIEIAVLDDNIFAPRDTLQTHKFRIIELGPDIRSLDQISTYSIIVCDVSGVGKAFGSELEGAHLVSEIRKIYPDKYLMAYTGLTYSLAITNALKSADKLIEKDARVEAWVQSLEEGINEIANPRKRWIRLRKALLEREVELFDVLKLEQAFIKSIKNKDQSILNNQATKLNISDEAKDVAIKFAATAVASIIEKTLGI